MVRHRFLALVPAVMLLAAFALPSGASALGMTDSYPREVAVTGTGEGVRLTRLEANVREVGGRVRVTVRLAGASTAGTRKLSITVAPCTVTSKKYKQPYDAPDAPSRPACKPAGTVPPLATVTEAPFSITRTFTIPRPATPPGALYVRVRVPLANTKPVPPCKGWAGSFCKQFRFTGDLLLNGNTWKYKPGTWWGITAQPPTGVTLDRIAFNSRQAGWVATSTAAAKVATTQGYAGVPPARTRTTSLLAGAQKTETFTTAFGGEFQTRPTIRVLDYAAAINGQRLFTVKLPLPIWQTPPR